MQGSRGPLTAALRGGQFNLRRDFAAANLQQNLACRLNCPPRRAAVSGPREPCMSPALLAPAIVCYRSRARPELCNVNYVTNQQPFRKPPHPLFLLFLQEIIS